MRQTASAVWGKYAYDHHIVDKPQISVETLSGIKYLDMKVENGKVTAVTVDMGEPEQTSELPEKIEVDGTEYEFTGISMGNPHAVLFMDEIDSLDLETIRTEIRSSISVSRIVPTPSLSRSLTAHT